MLNHRFLFLVLCLSLMSVASSTWARNEYIYRQEVNWVKLIDADPKETGTAPLKHPAGGISTDTMEAMLLSIQINKKFILKKTIESTEVFNSWEARKFAPLFVEALSKIGPDQMVNFAIIHKRPSFILQNDKLSIGNMWVADDGIHIRFSKLFAKISGDYQASSHMDKAIRSAKTLHVTLDVGQGQKLSYNSPMEIVLDENFNFAGSVSASQEMQRQAEEENLKAKKDRKIQKTPAEETEPTPAVNTSTGTVAERLKKLDSLKKQGLVTEKEYQDLRKKILSEI